MRSCAIFFSERWWLENADAASRHTAGGQFCARPKFNSLFPITNLQREKVDSKDDADRLICWHFQSLLSIVDKTAIEIDITIYTFVINLQHLVTNFQ
ncbi:hypothetical protein C7W93_10180 [Glaciimonas sp. PCH181]|nr:hypothetical protein C7W93_10180 [Glaciimonas sp. PCH181]